MLYKLFTFVRAPVSIICLLCLGLGVSVALAIQGVTTGKLAQCRPDALAWAGWLLALELLGVALFLFTAGLTDTDFDFLALGLVGALWTLPNALLFYRWRAKFVGQEKKKPGD